MMVTKPPQGLAETPVHRPPVPSRRWASPSSTRTSA